MELREIKEILGAEIITCKDDIDIEIERVYSADLMSDVLAFSEPGSLLVTALSNAQVVRTAEFANLKAVVFVQNKQPDKETVSLSEQKKIPLLVTKLSMFDACGRLHIRGLKSSPNAKQAQ